MTYKYIKDYQLFKFVTFHMIRPILTKNNKIANIHNPAFIHNALLLIYAVLLSAFFTYDLIY